jgi:hypothetical protein
MYSSPRPSATRAGSVSSVWYHNASEQDANGATAYALETLQNYTHSSDFTNEGSLLTWQHTAMGSHFLFQTAKPFKPLRKSLEQNATFHTSAATASQ